MNSLVTIEKIGQQVRTYLGVCASQRMGGGMPVEGIIVHDLMQEAALIYPECGQVIIVVANQLPTTPKKVAPSVVEHMKCLSGN